MKILVTGGAGFIGSNFVYFLLNKTDHDIVIVDKLTYAGNMITIRNALDSQRVNFYKNDIADNISMDYIFEKEQPDIVVNFAAESHVDNSIKNPGIFLTTNIIGTSVLMDMCKKHGIKRFHQVSTDEVYGDLPLDRPDLKFTEYYPLKTSSPYSSSKAGADLLVMAYHRTFGLPVSISRCSNNYGPYQYPEKLIPKTILDIDNGVKPGIYGKGENVRDWLYVEDHCEAIYKIIMDDKTIGEVYNIGGNNEKTNNEIVDIILSEKGKPADFKTYIEDRKGHDLRYAIDASKIKKDFGWSPRTKFNDGIMYIIQWYSENKGWLASL